MHILSWNLNHRTLEKTIPTGVIDVIRSLCPDILILNEYVDGPSRDLFKSELGRIGLGEIEISHASRGQNQILIASRFTHTPGDLQPPDITEHSKTNFLHRRFANSALEVVGIRVPAFKEPELQRAYWRMLSEIVLSVGSRRIVFIGDFNANPERPSTVGGASMCELRQKGWQIPVPDGAWSYTSHDGSQTSRIDHAIVSTQIVVESARYCYYENGIQIAGPKTVEPLSDHAALSIVLRQAS